MMTVGGFFANRIRRVSPPRISTSSSWTIFTTCCAGLSAWLTSAPRARSLTAATNSLTTGSATSASSSAILISRAVASMSASESRPLPRRFLRVSARRSERVANTANLSSRVVLAGTWRSAQAEGRAAEVPRVAAARPGLGSGRSLQGGAYGVRRVRGPVVGQRTGARLLDVEDVGRLGPEGAQVRRADGEPEPGQRPGDLEDHTEAVVGADLEDGGFRRGVVAHEHHGRQAGGSARQPGPHVH